MFTSISQGLPGKVRFVNLGRWTIGMPGVFEQTSMGLEGLELDVDGSEIRLTSWGTGSWNPILVFRVWDTSQVVVWDFFSTVAVAAKSSPMFKLKIHLHSWWIFQLVMLVFEGSSLDLVSLDQIRGLIDMNRGQITNHPDLSTHFWPNGFMNPVLTSKTEDMAQNIPFSKLWAFFLYILTGGNCRMASKRSTLCRWEVTTIGSTFCSEFVRVRERCEKLCPKSIFSMWGERKTQHLRHMTQTYSDILES